MEPVQFIRAAVGMTQRELADAAGTSQPTVAAYESGAKSPTWRTVERIASSVGLVCYPAVVRPLTRDQRGSLYLHAAVAKKLTNRPTEVIEIARKNIDKMRSVNPHAWRLLDEWERILSGDDHPNRRPYARPQRTCPRPPTDHPLRRATYSCSTRCRLPVVSQCGSETEKRVRIGWTR